MSAAKFIKQASSSLRLLAEEVEKLAVQSPTSSKAQEIAASALERSITSLTKCRGKIRKLLFSLEGKAAAYSVGDGQDPNAAQAHQGDETRQDGPKVE